MPDEPMPKGRTDAGFTLLEVLVAFIIAALALAVLFQGAVGGLRSARLSAQYQEATSRARSHLAAIGHGSRLAAGEQQGEDGRGFHWRLRIVPAGSVPAARGDAATVARGPVALLFDVAVTVSWRAEEISRAVTLEGRRVGIAPPAAP